MTKNVIKEIIIILLMCLAIILVLGLLLYEYVPMSKVIPEEVSYVTPENVQQELLETGGVDESQIVMTYEIDSTQLNNYRAIQDYKPGKTNPFSSYLTESTTTSGENTTSSSSSSGNTSNSTSSSGNSSTSSGSDSSSGGTYFQDTGTK